MSSPWLDAGLKQHYPGIYPVWLFAIFSISFEVALVFFGCWSLPTGLRRPGFLFHWELQSRICLVTISMSFLSVCPIQVHWCFSISVLILVWSVLFIRSVTLSCHWIFRMCLYRWIFVRCNIPAIYDKTGVWFCEICLKLCNYFVAHVCINSCLLTKN